MFISIHPVVARSPREWRSTTRCNSFVPNMQTYGIGQAASMAAVLLAAGTKGKRFSLPNSRIVIHQPLMSGLAGQATDIDIAVREILWIRERINDILVLHTGQPVKRIEENTERDYIMTAEQGKEYSVFLMM